jgi:hypothetical protein
MQIQLDWALIGKTEDRVFDRSILFHEIVDLLDPPPRRFAPPLQARRGNCGKNYEFFF